MNGAGVTALDAEAPLFAEDLARIYGISVRSGRDRLVGLEYRHGHAVVGVTHTGGTHGGRPRRYTTASALRAIKTHVDTGEPDRLLAMQDDLAAIERRVEELERKLTEVARRT
jgi:hypothetical protein